MKRREFATIFASGLSLASGCTGLSSTGTNQNSSAVFQSYNYERTELIVRFQDEATVEKAALVDRTADEQYQTVSHPSDSVRFDVVFPDRLASYISKDLYVEAKTSDGWVSQWVWEPVHGVAQNIEVQSDGRASFDIHNTGTAPLLVRFVGMYGNVPNPTVELQSESFDRGSFELGPGVVGAGRSRPLNPSRTDLVVGPDETVPFETIYRPFAFVDGAPDGTCDGTERNGEIGIFHSSGKIASYTFTYSASGGPVAVGGETDEAASQQKVEKCDTVTTSR